MTVIFPSLGSAISRMGRGSSLPDATSSSYFTFVLEAAEGGTPPGLYYSDGTSWTLATLYGTPLLAEDGSMMLAEDGTPILAES